MEQSADLNPSLPQPPRHVGLIDYVQVIAKWRRMILSVTLAAALISLFYSLCLPNIYTAKTMILPAPDDKGIMSAMLGQLGGVASLAGAAIGGPTTVDLYVSMLKSEAVKDPIIDRFKLIELYHDKDRTDTYKTLDKRAVVDGGKKDGIITITVDDKDPKRAAALANAYVEELGNLAIRLNVTGAGQNGTFLNERLAKARTDLIRAEENLRDFQARNKAVQVTAQAEASIKGIAELKAQVAAKEVQLAGYRRQFTDKSQEVKTLTTSVSNLRAQLANLEGGGGNSAVPSVGSVPAIGQQYVRLMREFKIQESLVELLTKQYEMAKFSEAKDVSPFQVILKAKVPEKKSKPARVSMVLTVILAALFSSLFLALVLENFSRMTVDEKQRWKRVLKDQGRITV